MTTVTIDDDLATRLRALRGGGDDFNRLVAEALAETVRRWEWEAAGRAEMRAMLDGPRHTPAEADERLRRKYGFPDLSHLTGDELADQAEATLAALPPEKVAEAQRLGLA
jgi:predicted transcriptional regulator